MAEKRRQYVKTTNGIVEQLLASHATIVDIDEIEGIEAENVQEALSALADLAATGGVTGVKGENEDEYRTGNVTITKEDVGLLYVTNDAQVKRSEMGVANGVATLNINGKVPSAQLPSFVDDVIEIAVMSETDEGIPLEVAGYVEGQLTKLIPESDKIYVHAIEGSWGIPVTNKTYRWSGKTFVAISSSLALGETEETAYAGNKGAKNATDIQVLNRAMGQVTEDITKIKDGTTKVMKSYYADSLATLQKITFTGGDVTGEFEVGVGQPATPKIDLVPNDMVHYVNPTTGQGTFSVLTVNGKGLVTAGAQLVEWGTSKDQTTPTERLAIGGIFYKLV